MSMIWKPGIPIVMFTKTGAYLNYDHSECKYVRLLTRWDGSEQDFWCGPPHGMALVGLYA